MEIADKPLVETAGAELRLARPFWADWSLWVLVCSNLWILALSLIQKWPLPDILWTFWFQSVIIGIFWFFKILALKNFSTDNLEINDRPVPPTLQTRNQTAAFFLFHYGFFHAGYAVFLATHWTVVNKWPIVIMAAIFVANHLFSFIHNRKWDSDTKPNLGTVMFFPYARIIPMHLTILFGVPLGLAGGSPLVIAFFMFLKTAADVTMHAIERAKFGSPTR
jgi:hypothetical protein